MRALALIALLALAACGNKAVLPDGTKLSEGAYVQIKTIEAVTESNKANTACYDAVGTIPQTATSDPHALLASGMAKALGIANCNTGQGQAQMQIPAYVPQPSVISQVVGTTVQLITGVAPVAGGVIQAKYNRDITLGAQAAQTAQNGQQWAGIGGIVRDTAQAQQATATGAVNAVATFGAAALNANANASAANATALTSAFAVLQAGFTVLPALKPSITAGRDVVQGNDNDLSTRGDTLTAGAEIRIASPGPIDIDMSQYTLVCTAAPAGPGSGTGTGGASSQVCTLVPRSP